jgi:hypothetical protein
MVQITSIFSKPNQPSASIQKSNPEDNVCLQSLATMSHLHSYAFQRALTETMGEGQAVLATKYAESLVKLVKGFNIGVSDMNSYMALLRSSRLALDVETTNEGPNMVAFNIKDCSIAKTVHKALGLSGHTGDICSLGMVFMVVKAMELGWEPGKNLFDYIRFTNKLSNYTDSGAKTEFEIVKRG